MNLHKISQYINYKLMVWIISFQVVGSFIGLSTKSIINPWYIDLNKSSLTPPGYIFTIAWPLLYISLAMFGYILHKEKASKSIAKLSIIYWLSVAFATHRPAPSAGMITPLYGLSHARGFFFFLAPWA